MATSFGPATSFQYKQVGITLELTPKVNATGDISLELAAEFSILGTRRPVGGGLFIPSVITRNITGVLRLRDGETSLLGGLVTSQESSTREGALGIEKIPLLNRIFGKNKKTAEDREVLISITPHVVRAPKITEDDLSPLGVGTEELVRVQGARPSLFGEPEAEPKPDGPTCSAGGRPRRRRAGPAANQRLRAADHVAPAERTACRTTRPRPRTTTPPRPVPNGRRGGNAAGGTVAAQRAPGAAHDEAGPAAPEGPVTALFSPPELSLNVTATGTLALVLVGARDVRSVDLSLTFDSRLVQAVDASPGSLLTLDGSSVGSQKSLEGGQGAAALHACHGRFGLRSDRGGGLQGNGAGDGECRGRVLGARHRNGEQVRDGSGAGPGRGGPVTGERNAMSKSKLLAAVLALAHLTCAAVPLTAPSGSSLSINANPEFVAANGGASAVTVVVVEPAGTFVPDGTVVFFLTNLGRIDAQAKTKDGFAACHFRFGQPVGHGAA